MSRLRREAVRVVVPATSANLGPAFDCAGLALDLQDDLVAMASDDEGVLVEVAGEGASAVPRDASHLVVRAMAAAFVSLDVRPAGFVLRCTNRIPHGRGLGSSAAAIVGGLVLARALVEDGADRLPDDDLLQLALAFESHPDNISAALHGGFTLAWLDDAGAARCVRLDPHPEVHPVVVVPPTGVLTESARAVLPRDVPLADAAANVGRAALLVHALTTDPTRLMDATRDRLHQQARAAVYGPSVELVERLRAAGIPAVISGAGPSVLALPGTGSTGDVAGIAASTGWAVQALAVAGRGAREVPVSEGGAAS
jgi:homoserine kinase